MGRECTQSQPATNPQQNNRILLAKRTWHLLIGNEPIHPRSIGRRSRPCRRRRACIPSKLRRFRPQIIACESRKKSLAIALDRFSGVAYLPATFGGRKRNGAASFLGVNEAPFVHEQDDRDLALARMSHATRGSARENTWRMDAPHVFSRLFTQTHRPIAPGKVWSPLPPWDPAFLGAFFMRLTTSATSKALVEKVAITENATRYVRLQIEN